MMAPRVVVPSSFVSTTADDDGDGADLVSAAGMLIDVKTLAFSLNERLASVIIATIAKKKKLRIRNSPSKKAKMAYL